MDMHDLGHKSETTLAVPESKQEKRITYPSLYLENAPEAMMDKDIGHICRLEIIAKVKSKSIDERNDKTQHRMEFEVQKIGYVAKAGGYSKEEYLSKSQEDREKIDEEEVMEGEKE